MRHFNRLGPLAAAAVLALAFSMSLGCQRAPTPANSERARTALATALAAWKRGDSREALRRQPAPIYCNDDDWAAGRRLQSYQIADTDDHFGWSCRIVAQLVVEHTRGAPVQKKIVYLIDTAAAVVIVRDR